MKITIEPETETDWAAIFVDGKVVGIVFDCSARVGYEFEPHDFYLELSESKQQRFVA